MSLRAVAHVRLLGGLGLTLAAAPAIAARKLNSPGPLKGQTAAGGVALSWSDDLVERRASGGGSFAEVAKTTADRTSCTDGVGTTLNHEYRVRAYRTAP